MPTVAPESAIHWKFVDQITQSLLVFHDSRSDCVEAIERNVRLLRRLGGKVSRLIHEILQICECFLSVVFGVRFVPELRRSDLVTWEDL